MGGFITVDMKNLVLRSSGYHVELSVPKLLRRALGRTVFRVNLRTRDEMTARTRRDSELVKLRGILAAAAARMAEQAGQSPSRLRWLEQRALSYGEAIYAAPDSSPWSLPVSLMVRTPAAPLVATPARVIPTFQAAAAEAIETKRHDWRKDEWTPSFVRHAYPHIGDMAVDKIDVEALLAFLGPLARSNPETASKVRGRIEGVLAYCKGRGWTCGDNPAETVTSLLPNKRKAAPVVHHPALPWKELPAFMAQLTERTGTDALAFRFAILTTARTSEVLGATWSEIDLEGRLWVVPASRMKAGRQHRVALSGPAVALLKALPRDGSNVFTGARGGTLGHATLFKLLRTMGRADLTAHGMRSTFRDWCAETGKDEALAEASLAHARGDQTERSYARSDLLDRRRGLMDQWAQFCMNG